MNRRGKEDFESYGDYGFPGVQETDETKLSYVDMILVTWTVLPLGGFPGGPEGKVSAYNVGDLGSIPELERSSGEGNGNPLQYSCLENPMDGGTW